jgi:hypothetical protein
MATAYDALKHFAMTTQLIEHDLDLVEGETGFEFGRGHLGAVDVDERYYPQIEQDIRAEAAMMAPHYEMFYSLEKTIRRLIGDTMQAADGASWWDGTRIRPELKQVAEDRQQREIDSAVTPRSPEPIDFLTFGELSQIIRQNWDLFGSIFSSVKAVERVMANLNTLRAPIAHCSLLADDEVVRLRLTVRDWFRLME